MLNEKTICELQDLLQKREIRPQEIVEDVFQQIERVEERLGAYITLTKEFAFKQAEDGIRDPEMSRGLGDVYKRQGKDYVTILREPSFCKLSYSSIVFYQQDTLSLTFESF